MNSQLKLQLTQKIQLEDSSLFFIALRVMSLLYALKRGENDFIFKKYIWYHVIILESGTQIFFH